MQLLPALCSSFHSPSDVPWKEKYFCLTELQTQHHFTPQLRVFTYWTAFWSHWQVGRKMWSAARSKVSSLLTLAGSASQMLNSLFPVFFGWRYWSIKEHQEHTRPQKHLPEKLRNIILLKCVMYCAYNVEYGLLHPYLRQSCTCISTLL